MVVRNPFQKDYDHMSRIPHYTYRSPKQEPDPTESFVGDPTQILRKPVYYHNLYYKSDTIFVEEKSPSTTTNNKENFKVKISYNHQNCQESHGILDENYGPKDI